MAFLKNSRKTRILISAALFIISFAVYNVPGSRYCASGDTVGNELLAISLIREGDFDYNEFCPSGNEEELGSVFEWSKGSILNICPVVTGMMNVPVFLAADAFGIDIEEKMLPLNKVTMSLIAAFSTVLMFFILLKNGFSIKRSTLLAVVFSFGTLVWSVTSRGTWQHGPSIFFLCAGMLLYSSKRRKIFAWAGFFFTLMCVNRPVNGLIILPFYAHALFHRRKDFIPFALTSLIPLAFLAWYSLEYWGSLLSLGQGQGAKFGGDLLLAVPGMLISPSRGLLIFSPVFVFSLLYMIRDVFRKGGDVLDRYITVGFILTLICYSFWERWSGGHCFGYRYLSEFIPILILFLAKSWDRYIAPRRLTKVIFVLLFAAAIYINFLGAFVYPSGFNHIPNNIDFHPERLWCVHDTEITRCHTRLVDYITSYF